MENKKINVDVIVLNSHGVGQICHIKRLPRRGETLEATNWRVEEDGGKGATVSVALGRLGVKAGYIGKVGFDPWGDMGDKWMSESGVDTTFMYRDASVSTGTGLIMVDEEGYNSIVDGDSACKALTEDEIRTAIDSMKSAKYFITGFGMPYEKALLGAKIAKKEYGMVTFCNASPLPSEDMGNLDYIDYLILNDIEAKVLMELDEDTEVDCKEITTKISQKHNCKGVIMTMGENGSCIYDDGNYWYVEALKVKAIDTIGAGDGYLAAIVAGLVWGKSIEESSKWASMYSACKVTRKGSMTRKPGQGYPYIEEVNNFIKENTN